MNKAPGMDKITGRLVSTRFESQNGGMFRILVVKTIENKFVTVLGYMEIEEGILYNFIGNWETSKFGEQFRVVDYSPYKDFIRTRENVIGYISSRLFEGIGPARAQQIYEKFGEDTIHIVEDEPEKLTLIKGITDRTVSLIRESFQRNVRFRELTIALSKEGISDNMIDKIYAKYGPDSINIVRNTPYRMAYEIDGIGFRTADRIALAADATKYHSTQRIQAGIYFALKEQCDTTGNLYTEFSKLEAAAKKYLDTISNDHITRRELDSSLVCLCRDKKVILRDGQFYLAKYYFDERQSVNYLVDLIGSDCRYNMNRDEISIELEKIQKHDGIQYSSLQKQAIINSLENTVSIITGGPGTGKSTIINAIIKIFAKKTKGRETVIPCAPTGKAAKRMKEITGKEAFTIHRMLKVEGNTGKFHYNQDNPIPASLIIADEFSMVDISLFRHFISAIPKGECKVIFVGDTDQLPSVGPGNVLRDMITSEYIPTVKLTDIFRQKSTSSIVVNSHIINEGKGKFQLGDDFEFIRVMPNETEQEIFDRIIELYKKSINEFREVQVLTPYRSKKHIISTESLNGRLSEIANPENQKNIVFSKGDISYHIGDKVMQIRNNYSKKVFNGETGTIIRMEKEGSRKIGIVDFGDNRLIDYVSAEELDLAYATTIHKSQGSEFECVIMPVIRQNIYFLDKSIVYTGLTRAKKKCSIISEPKTWVISCKKALNRQRKTNMSEDIRKLKNTGTLYDYARFNESDLEKLLKGQDEKAY